MTEGGGKNLAPEGTFLALLRCSRWLAPLVQFSTEQEATLVPGLLERLYSLVKSETRRLLHIDVSCASQ